MYHSNYLANQLRASSLSQEQNTFALQLNGSVMTYGDLFQQAEDIASTLISLGLMQGDRVAVQVDKSLRAIQLYLGTVLAGGVFLPLNTDYTPAEVDYFLGDAQPCVFVCKPENLEGLSQIAEKNSINNLLTLASDGDSGTLITAIANNSNEFKVVERSEDDLAAILYTSGTTGRSKGAMLSHKALASNSAALAEHWQFTSNDCLIHALPIFHTHGLFVAINVTLTAGSSLIFMQRFNVDNIIDALPKATVLMGVPTFYVRLLQHAGLNKQSTANMRLFISGSAPLLSETHELWYEKTGHAILERYGMTETNMNTSNPYDGERRPGTVGMPLPGVEVKITHPDTGEELTDGEVGQIEVRGPNVFSGYWKMPEKTAEELRPDGWFMSGDLAVRDPDGYISIVGRSKDMIISGGYNVYPKEIEAVIDELPSVNESAIIGLPHSDFGECVVAVVVPLEGENPTEDDIKNPIKDCLASYKRPKKVIFLPELPRNTMGKVQKAALRETYRALFSKS